MYNYVGYQLRWQPSHSHAWLWLPPQVLWIFLLSHKYHFCEAKESKRSYWEARFSSVTTPMVWGNKYYRGNNGQNTNIPILRLAEMYLTRAIIRFRQADIGGATSDVNVVRMRAGLDALDTVTEEDIHNERIKEMSWEADRIDYLRALKLPIPPGSRNPSLPNSIIEYPYTAYVWPIPKGEYDLNSGYGK